MDWDKLRAEEFPVAERWAYLDHAAVAPLPRRAADAFRAWAAEQEANGTVYWPARREELEVIRGRVARLIGSAPEEVAFVNSTTQGINIVAEGFPWREGDNVVTAFEEYPSNIYPWMNQKDRGVETRLVKTRSGRIWPEDLREAIDDRTRVLTISHVEFASGFRNDLDAIGELCRSRGVAFFVDAIQGLGPLEIDVSRTPVDFLAADGHKWLLGPEGAGFLYVREDWIDRLRATGVGWNSVVGSYNRPDPDFTLKPEAGRWEGGSYNMPGLLALGKSLELLLEIGPAEVSRRILDRAEAAREAARSAGWTLPGSDRPGDRSGIVPMERPGVDHDAVVRLARDRGVALSCRRGKLRVSPHLYTNAEDLERLAGVLRSAGA